VIHWNMTSFMADPDRAARGGFWMKRAAPHPALAAHIEHYFAMRWSFAPGVSAHSLAVPAGTVKWFFERRETPSNAIAGPATEPVRPEFNGTGMMVGVSFRPGGAARFSRARAVDLVDTYTGDVRAVIGPLANELGARIFEARSAADAFSILDAHLVAELGRTKQTTSELHVRRFLCALDRTPRLARVANLARDIGTSERALQRSFLDAVGVSPAFILRLARLHRTLREIAARPTPLSRTAAAHGYFDQAHFSNELRQLTGYTPSSLAGVLPRVVFFQAPADGNP
jgi:AraC-like DNA-binding protein